jgi:hypothetical protein
VLKLKLAIKINQIDNVATITDRAKKGEVVSVLSEEGKEIDKIKLPTDAPLPFHKIALKQIAKGEEIKKYGEVLGHASKSILKGEWIHVHNIESASLPQKEVK